MIGDRTVPVRCGSNDPHYKKNIYIYSQFINHVNLVYHDYHRQKLRKMSLK